MSKKFLLLALFLFGCSKQLKANFTPPLPTDGGKVLVACELNLDTKEMECMPLKAVLMQACGNNL